MKFILSDFFILVFYFSYKLILLSDKSILFLVSGSKVNKYIKRYNQQKLTCNFENAKNNKFKSFSLYNFVKSFRDRKDILNISLLSMCLLSIKFAITFKYIFVKFFYFNIFGKNIDLVSILEDKYFIFILVYYILSLFFIINITSKLMSFIKRKIKKENSFELENGIYLGIDDKNNEKVYLKNDGLYQNILITGSIGSGKTSSAISNILNELIKKNVYGLVIDVKGSFLKTVIDIARNNKKEDSVIVISMENDFKYNPLNKPNLSSSELANYMIRVLKVLSNGNTNSDPFWLDKSEAYIRDFITIIRVYNDEFVNFLEIHKLVTSNNYIEEKLGIIKERILNNEFDDKKLFELNSAINNIRNEYMKLDERVIGIIKSEITRLTNLFICDYNVYQKFCTDNSYLNFLDKKIVTLSISIGSNKLLSKVIATYLKLDYEQQILSRNNNDTPVFFICDEFQEIVNIEDSNFFSLSREYKAINVISTQSYSSLISMVQNEKNANVIIQNLVNKIWFRNDDMYTVKKIISQIGKEDKKSESISYTESGHNSRYSIISKEFKDYKTGMSKSFTLNTKNDYKFNEEYITSKLNTFEAICFLSDGKNISIIEKMRLKRWENEQK